MVAINIKLEITYDIVEFEDTKGVIRICKSKKNKQHNGKKEKVRKENDYLQSRHIKLKIE